ncbi:nucleoside hydrolase [Reichenbachiella carrageenanivorans]|uniref:Nucleoside hydrolase n=1 Tax=Reichenbachiella carrageenanivorans TaxID=2979869 RepID=A0ABY6D5C8_9BACT|nr:nucleoside hydrolase [Reichenbachiella carrageenanivorans]UXX81019.1 nucleoside hydrolase [Reichenbachiella carrageenanivorans]
MRKFLFLPLICLLLGAQAQNKKYILDADTGNEMDDFYAIVRALLDPDMNIIALNSAHYNTTHMFMDSVWNENPVTDFNTVGISQAYNEELLTKMGRLDLPHPLGCNRSIGYAWGYYPSAPVPPSPAVDMIVAEAKKASPDNKLGVICIGASTNLAAAIETDPSIAKNIDAYLLGARYEPSTQVWNKSEFNIRNDLSAFDVLLNNQDLELTVMSITTARPYTFLKTPTLKRLYAYDDPVTDLLGDIWTKINAAESRVMWDLALIIAIQKPELATLEKCPAPPENKRKFVNVYTQIDVEAMRADFWKYLDDEFGKAK